MREAGTISHQTEAAGGQEASSRRAKPWGSLRTEKPYSVACAWVDADPRVRVKRSVQAAANYKAISLLPRAWGEKLDALGVAHNEIKWLAGTTGHGHAAAREARYLALVQMFEAPNPDETRTQSFARIVDKLPKVRRAKRTRVA